MDPPFLSEECWTKFAITIRKLAKPDAKLIVCTGAIMKDFLSRILPSLGVSSFKVVHRDQRLSNDFLCLVSYVSRNPLFAVASEEK